MEVIIKKGEKVMFSFDPTADDMFEIMRMAYDIKVEQEEKPKRKYRKHKKYKKRKKNEETLKEADDVFEREVKKNKEISENPSCPYCGSNDVWKDGHRRKGGLNFQYYQCKKCQKRFTDQDRKKDTADIEIKEKWKKKRDELIENQSKTHKPDMKVRF